MNTALSIPPTSCAMVLHENGSIEFSMPNREAGDDVPPRVLFLAALSMLLEREDAFIGEIVRRGFAKPPVN